MKKKCKPLHYYNDYEEFIAMDLRTLNHFLADLESRLDEAEELRVEQEWLDFADLKRNSGAFRTSRVPKASAIDWPKMLVNDALEDVTDMIYQQLWSVNQTLEAGGGEMHCIRSNYGTCIIPSMFDVQIHIMPRSTDTLPGNKPFADGSAGIRRMLSQGKAWDFTKNFAGKTFEMAERYLSLAKAYPKVSRFIHYYNPDLQGPLALCETLWGSSFYEDFYDEDAMESHLLEDALDYFTELYLDFTDRFHRLAPTFDPEHSVEWGCLHRGGTIIRNDSAMNISGDLYQEFVMPRDQKIISAVGGGIHFCGKGDHYIQHVAAIEGLTCINMSEPARNNMEKIYSNTVDRDIIIFGLLKSEVDRAIASGRELHGRVHAGASTAAWLGKRD